MIRYLRADSNYTIVNFKNGRSVVSGYNLSFYENLFRDKGFIRIDRSNLVNKSYIARLFTDASGNYIQLRNDCVLQIPRRRKAKLINQIQLCCERTA